MDGELDRAAKILNIAKQVAVFSGAGVSAESGVPTFRASDGLWEGHRIEDVATPEGFENDPDLVWAFYNARRENVGNVKPNAGHTAIADLEKLVDRVTVATQNVDGLHLVAGSTTVHELHGSLRETRCLSCGVVKNRGLEVLGPRPKCPVCDGQLRPNIVWFGESLPRKTWAAAEEAVTSCDALFVVGTSAVVYPAAGLISLAKSVGAAIIEVNLTQTNASGYTDIGLYGPSGVVLPKVVERLRKLRSTE
jgi:NAD-dependent deacetylase